MNQINDSNNLTIEKDIQVSRTGELVIGVIVSGKKTKNDF
jgi:hypothetical protein